MISANPDVLLLVVFHHQLFVREQARKNLFSSLSKSGENTLCKFWSFFFYLNTRSSCGLVAGLNLHKPTRVTTALEVLDCPKVRNYLLSGIWKFRNLSFPILQNSSVSFPTQATVSLIKILYIESP